MERTALEDHDLVERARERDVDAFAEIVRRYEVRIRSVLVRLLDDDRDVEEAVQDCFVRAWRSLDRFRGDSALFTWLYRIAVNEALMRLRRKQLPLSELDETLQAGPSSPSDDPAVAAEGSDLRAFLAGRIRALEFDYRAPLVLRDVVGLSNQEVAEVLDLSLPAAKSRIHRARMQIREELDLWERGTGGGWLPAARVTERQSGESARRRMWIWVDGGRIQAVVSVVMYPWVATCAETRERLSAHLEGELEGRDAKRVQRHLARCRFCQAMLRSLTRAVEGVRSLGQGEVQSAVPSAADAVVERIRRGDTHDP